MTPAKTSKLPYLLLVIASIVLDQLSKIAVLDNTPKI